MRPDAQTTGARNTGAQATSAQQDGALEVAVLVSVGRHPVTGNQRSKLIWRYLLRPNCQPHVSFVSRCEGQVLNSANLFLIQLIGR